MSLAEDVVGRYLRARRGALEIAPLNAGFDIDTETAAQDCLEFVIELQAAQLIKAV